MLTRGIDSVQKAEQFLDLKINKLHNPFSLPDAQIAIERISKAIDSGEKIFVKLNPASFNALRQGSNVRSTKLSANCSNFARDNLRTKCLGTPSTAAI